MKKLWFIALIPPDPVLSEVRSFKEEMRDRFGAAHALKSPAHITLQMPFRMDADDEIRILGSLQKAARNCVPSELFLEGFDCFAPRVLFVRVANHKPVKRWHQIMKPLLPHEARKSQRGPDRELHPHMTIATRDLTEECFHRAWPEFSNREYRRSFPADGFSLLLHNGKFWDRRTKVMFETGEIRDDQPS